MEQDPKPQKQAKPNLQKEKQEAAKLAKMQAQASQLGPKKEMTAEEKKEQRAAAAAAKAAKKQQSALKAQQKVEADFKAEPTPQESKPKAEVIA